MIYRNTSGIPASRIPLPLTRFAVWLRLSCLAVAASVSTQMVQAQTPETIALAKIGFHQQASATNILPAGTGFIVEVYFAETVASSVLVNLQTPRGQTIPLWRTGDDSYAFNDYFNDEAQLAAAYPSGDYSILVSGGDSATTTTFSVSSGVAAPVTITNFTALQAAGATQQVTWQPIPAVGSAEALNLELISAGGVELSSQALTSARVTSGTFSNLLEGETYSGILTYLTFDVTTANKGLTNIGVGGGFSMAFPVFRGSATPAAPGTPAAAGAYASGPTEVTITWQPPDGANPATSYKLERATDSSFKSGLVTITINQAATSYIDASVAADTTYYYRLSATNATGTSAPTAGMRVQTPAIVGSGASRFVNISTRAYCSTGNNVTIGGFVLNGTSDKRVLIRAVGPSLTAQGIGESESLLDPSIEVHRGASVIASNDDWTTNDNAADIVAVATQIGAAALQPTDTKSSALLLSLAPGVYSFVANGHAGTSGIVLLEVYDADTPGSASTFVNISTRAYSTGGNGVTIGGFVINGGASKQVLIRAVGPTLTTYGLGSAEVLSNPVIELHQGAPVIATNDNWTDNDNASSIISTSARIGAAPFASTDATSAALLLKLPPGVYSFIARGKSNASGITLVEVYDAD